MKHSGQILTGIILFLGLSVVAGLTSAPGDFSDKNKIDLDEIFAGPSEEKKAGERDNLKENLNPDVEREPGALGFEPVDRDHLIRGEDESVLERSKRSELKSKIDFSQWSGGFIQEKTSGIKSKEDNKISGVYSNSHVEFGYGNNDLFGLNVFLAKTEFLDRIAGGANPDELSLDRALLKGRRLNLKETDADILARRAFRPNFTYMVNYDRWRSGNQNRLAEERENSFHAKDDFLFTAALRPTRDWTNKLSLYYFQQDFGTQEDTTLARGEANQVSFRSDNYWQLGSLSRLHFYLDNQYHDSRYHPFAAGAGNILSAGRMDLKLGAGAEFQTSRDSSHRWTLAADLNFFQNQSANLDAVTLANGDADPFVAEELVMAGEIMALDTWTLVPLKSGQGVYGLALEWGARLGGATERTGWVGPVVRLNQNFTRDIAWSVGYDYVGWLIPYREYFTRQAWTLPAQSYNYTREHRARSDLQVQITSRLKTGLETTVGLAEDYPLWRETSNHLFTTVGRDINYLTNGVFLEYELDDDIRIRGGLDHYYEWTDETWTYQPAWMPYAGASIIQWKFHFEPRLRYVSSRPTGIAAEPELDDYFRFDLRVERKILGSLVLFLDGRNLLNQKVEAWRNYQQSGLTVQLGGRVMF